MRQSEYHGHRACKCWIRTELSGPDPEARILSLSHSPLLHDPSGLYPKGRDTSPGGQPSPASLKWLVSEITGFGQGT